MGVSGDALEGDINLSYVTSEEWNFVVGESAKVIEKLNKVPIKLRDITTKIFQGL